MKIGLVSYQHINKDIEYNLKQIERAMVEGNQLQLDLLVFSETFLQRFNSLCWDYSIDQNMTITQNSKIMIKSDQALSLLNRV